MAVEIYVPKMSDHMERGTILRWLVHDGEQVHKGQVLLELETDKAVGEIEAPTSGVLRGVSAGEGADVPVGAVIAYILQPGELLPVQSHQDLAVAQSHSPYTPKTKPAPTTATDTAPGEGQILAAPAARRLARELGVDLHQVKGSGPGGRIKEEDVRAYAEAHKDTP